VPAPPEDPGFRVEPARPFKAGDAPLKPAVVLLEEYLARAKRPKKPVVVTLELSPGSPTLRAVLGDLKMEAPFAFPATMNEALMGLAERITAEAGKRLEAKKLLPFLNEARSPRATLRYADGVLALKERDFEKAVAAFEESLRSDYNYVFAYAGLAEAQAGLALKTGSEDLRRKARANLEKAKLLNPYRAKIREDRVNFYLKASCGKPEGRL
jgi:tetratricopeptide (TPR) repeat protein